MRIQDFFEHCKGTTLTYDDLILLPGLMDCGLNDVCLSSNVTREIRLKTPVVSSPMDTVTGADLAIAMALQGGIGVLHYNVDPVEQRAMAQQVKRYKNGFVTDPVTVSPSVSLDELMRIQEEYGYSTIPVVENQKLVGMVTKYDYSLFAGSPGGGPQRVSDRMIPLSDHVVATLDEITVSGAPSLAKANEILLESHAPALPIVDNEQHLLYLITRSDLEKHENFPLASVNHSTKSLMVGAAVEAWPDKARERLEQIEDVVDLIVFDTSQGYTRYQLELIHWTKEHYPHLQIIGGNVVTAEATEALIRAGADGIRVGMGSGSICTTQEVGGIGRGQATAVYACAQVAKQYGVPVIADGGIKQSSDIVKAFAVGAGGVMLGSMLACTKEALGKTVIQEGVKVKVYEGMGSLGAMERGGGFRYGTQKSAVKIPEGVSGRVSYKGSAQVWVPSIAQGIRQGLHKLGVCSVEQLQQWCTENKTVVERRSEAAKREGYVHDLYSYK